MNCMILHPNGNMAIVVDEVVYDITVAVEKFPDITNDLIAAGKFENSGVLVGNHYYTSSPEVKFQLNMHNDYPQPYLVQDVEQCAGTFGCIIEKRQFNWCYMLGHSTEDISDFVEWCRNNRPGWDAKIPEPEVVQEAAVTVEESLVVEEVQSAVEEVQSIVEEPPVAEEEKQEILQTKESSDVFTRAMWDAQNGFNPGMGRPTPEQAILDEQAIKEVVITPEVEYETMSLEEAEAFVDEPVTEQEQTEQEEFILPEECKGETWAQTWKRCRPADVVSDAFCIEKNWEKRGDYYIIDCVMSGMRLIHSDKQGVNIEISAKVCR